ncbi:MAG: hypothetical protein ACPGU5_00300 [Lishizhenia sp.]
MKEELKSPEVNNVSVAVAFEEGVGATIYNVYLINERTEMLENVLVSSTGYGLDLKTNQKIKTSTLRHSLGNIEPRSTRLIEPIMDTVFGLTNQFWVSFWMGNKMYDKKFIFLAESIKKENLIDLPLLGLKGVLIK